VITNGSLRKKEKEFILMLRFFLIREIYLQSESSTLQSTFNKERDELRDQIHSTQCALDELATRMVQEKEALQVQLKDTTRRASEADDASKVTTTKKQFVLF
jgi:ABC-type transport system involved in cytochrome bd biosynthesis fused ATPase/permease subunit